MEVLKLPSQESWQLSHPTRVSRNTQILSSCAYQTVGVTCLVKAEIERFSICMFFMSKIKYLLIFVTHISFLSRHLHAVQVFLRRWRKTLSCVMTWASLFVCLFVFSCLSFESDLLVMRCGLNVSSPKVNVESLILGGMTQRMVIRSWEKSEWFNVIIAGMDSYWRESSASFCFPLSFPRPSTTWVRMQ